MANMGTVRAVPTRWTAVPFVPGVVTLDNISPLNVWVVAENLAGLTDEFSPIETTPNKVCIGRHQHRTFPELTMTDKIWVRLDSAHDDDVFVDVVVTQ